MNQSNSSYAHLLKQIPLLLGRLSVMSLWECSNFLEYRLIEDIFGVIRELRGLTQLRQLLQVWSINVRQQLDTILSILLQAGIVFISSHI